MARFTIPPDWRADPPFTTLASAGPVNWGHEALRLAALTEVVGGATIKVGLVDTGVDRTHPLLQNCFAAKSFIPGEDASDPVSHHGTHTSGILAASDPRIGTAAAFPFAHAKALSNAGSGDGNGIADGIDWLDEQGCEVISLSLGSAFEDAAIIAALKRFAAKGKWAFCAAGNSGGNTPNVDWPARSSYCISVAASNRDLSTASFSNRGAKIDCAAPGVDIVSTVPGGYASMSGTSMACPWATGAGAKVRAGMHVQGIPIPDINGLRTLLFNNVVDRDTPGVDLRSGPGTISPVLLANGVLQLPIPPIG